MLWIWSYPLSKKAFFLKLVVPKKLAKHLKTICDKLRFYCIFTLCCGLKLIKKPLSLEFPKGFAKLTYHLHYTETYTAQKTKFFIKDLFSKRNCGFGHVY